MEDSPGPVGGAPARPFKYEPKTPVGRRGRISSGVRYGANPASGLVTLPESLLSTGDPVPDNPYPVGSTRHLAWAAATDVAEGELCDLKSRTPGSSGIGSDAYVRWWTRSVSGKLVEKKW